jgi:hypothetical protein
MHHAPSSLVIVLHLVIGAVLVSATIKHNPIAPPASSLVHCSESSWMHHAVVRSVEQLCGLVRCSCHHQAITIPAFRLHLAWCIVPNRARCISLIVRVVAWWFAGWAPWRIWCSAGASTLVHHKLVTSNHNPIPVPTYSLMNQSDRAVSITQRLLAWSSLVVR